jgi:hypothetical protein
MPRGTVRREVVDGELREMHPAGADHGTIAARRPVTRYRSAADITVFADDEPIDCSPAMPGFEPTPRALIPLL